MESEDDYIILASNVKSFAEDNTVSRFKTQLARKRTFPPNEEWRVALSEISYKQSWFNVNESFTIKFRYIDGRFIEMDLAPEAKEELTVPAGYYETVESLVDSINEKFKVIKNYISPQPKLYFNNITHKISILPGKIQESIISSDSPTTMWSVLPSLGGEIESILGLTNAESKISPELIIQNGDLNVSNDSNIVDQIRDVKKIKGIYPVDINAGFNNLYVYSNIVRQSDVGDSFAPILTSIPNKRSKDGWGGSVHHEPKNLVYRPLQLRSFDTIDIDIKDDSGASVPFQLGNVVVKLHFKKYG